MSFSSLYREHRIRLGLAKPVRYSPYAIQAKNRDFAVDP
jgi:hypothetical protein